MTIAIEIRARASIVNRHHLPGIIALVTRAPQPPSLCPRAGTREGQDAARAAALGAGGARPLPGLSGRRGGDLRGARTLAALCSRRSPTRTIRPWPRSFPRPGGGGSRRRETSGSGSPRRSSGSSRGARRPPSPSGRITRRWRGGSSKRSSTRLALGSEAAVIPAEDGGYCAIGLAAGVPVRRGLFGTSRGPRRAFSPPRVSGLPRSGCDAAVLEPAYDVDRPEDLDRLRRTSRGGTPGTRLSSRDGPAARVPRGGLVIPVLDARRMRAADAAAIRGGIPVGPPHGERGGRPGHGAPRRFPGCEKRRRRLRPRQQRRGRPRGGAAALRPRHLRLGFHALGSRIPTAGTPRRTPRGRARPGWS